MDLFTRVPAVILRIAISRNSNVVKPFEARIESYKGRLSPEEMAKVGKVLEMPVPELQELLDKAHAKTHQKQFKLLADPRAEPFIAGNLRELKKLLFP